MQAILAGKPAAQLQAACTGTWEGQAVVAYISGSALVICNGPDSLLQTIYHDEIADEGLVAVAYHPDSGKIAAASSKSIHVYELREEIKGELRWSFYVLLSLPEGEKDTVTTLSWGSDEELLVGSRKLTLFSTHLPTVPSTPRQGHPNSTRKVPKTQQSIWSVDLPSSVTHATFSPSTSLIASISLHDRLVKIWRRLSLETPSFDYTYLPHPATVTHVEWRSPGGSSAGDEDVLYTTCADGRLRVWKAASPRNIEILSLHAELDMFSAVQPRDKKTTNINPRRYAFLIPPHVFDAAAKHTLEARSSEAKSKHALEYLKELASREPDIVVVMDNQGHMSAWGLENVGCKRRNSFVAKTDFFHAAHVEDASFGFEPPPSAYEDNARIMCFPVPHSPGDIAVLVNHFDGRIQWWQGSVQQLFDPSSSSNRMRLLANWTGHSSAIKKVIRTASGKALISRTIRDEGIVWRQRNTRGGTVLSRKSKAKINEHIHRTLLLRDGEFVVFLHHESISLWDARQPLLTEAGRCSYSIAGKAIALLVLPEADPSSRLVHVATVTTEMHGLVWELSLPPPSTQQDRQDNAATFMITIRKFCTFELGHVENLSYFLPVDPAGSSPVVSGFLDSFAQDTAIAWTTTGVVQTWTAKVNLENTSVDWLKLSHVDTGIQEPSLGSGTSIRKAAIVDKSRSTLTIWDTKSGRLDYEETFPNQIIQDLDWASTPDNQSILAVGFPHTVFVYTQLRYDYVSERPSWTRIKEVDIRNLSPHPIGDSVWLGSGNLVIGAGNQLFVVSSTIDPRTDLSADLQASAPHKAANSIYDVVRTLNGPLPVFHPQFIAQCVLAGKLNIVHRILLALHKTLKFYTEGEELDSFQGTLVEDYMSEEVTANGTTRIHKSYSALDLTDEEPASITEELASSLTALLSDKSIPQLSGTEQLSLVDVVECIGLVEKHRRSIDENAARFLLFWRESLTRSRQTANQQHKQTSPGSITWREMVWAYHSSSQDILVATITQHHKGRLEWTQARDTGMFMWLTDREALMAQFEAIARNAYSSSEPKNPVDCALYYLALRKKAVLQGLWRMATWSREQAATTRLLKNDFTDPRWRTAAAKNAYALMGKRRFEYAAAFFLLADDLKSAVSVLSNQLGDVQLAIAVARVYGGDESPILVDFLQTRVLPAAAGEGNRWQTTWGYWLLGKRSLAVRALINPLHSLLEPPTSPLESLRAKSFLNDDPALVILYKQLREKSLQTLKGALMITGKEEWEFITKTASLLLRMGCDVLALDLVRNWEFLQQHQQPPPPRHDEVEEEGQESVSALPARKPLEMDPRKLLRRRSSLVVADLPEADRPPPASILDGWGMSTSKAEPSGQKSMLDDWGMSPQPSKNETAPTKSMLDDWGMSSQPSKRDTAPAKSMLDDWGMSPQASNTESAPTRSMLDDYSMHSPPKKTKNPPVKSMLDDFDTPAESNNKPVAMARSMLDDWDTPAASKQQTTLPIRSTNKDKDNSKSDEAQTENQISKEGEKKAANGTTEDGKQKPPPTQFKEPDPNSLLDAFGF